MKLLKPRVRTLRRQHAFSIRIVDTWNSLPQDVISADTVNNFKIRLDKYSAVLGRKGRNTNFFRKLVLYGAHIMGTYPTICGGELAKKKNS